MIPLPRPLFKCGKFEGNLGQSLGESLFRSEIPFLFPQSTVLAAKSGLKFIQEDSGGFGFEFIAPPPPPPPSEPAAAALCLLHRQLDSYFSPPPRPSEGIKSLSIDKATDCINFFLLLPEFRRSTDSKINVRILKYNTEFHRN